MKEINFHLHTFEINILSGYMSMKQKLAFEIYASKKRSEVVKSWGGANAPNPRTKLGGECPPLSTPCL